MELTDFQKRQQSINALNLKIILLKEDLKEVMRKGYDDTSMRVIVVQILNAEKKLKKILLSHIK
jgi:hypothetical protein